MATVVDSVSDEFLMPSAMGAPGDASVEHAMQPVGPKRRLRRIFDNAPHAGSVRRAVGMLFEEQLWLTPRYASMEHAMQPMGPRRRLRRVFDDVPHARSIRKVGRSKFQTFLVESETNDEDYQEMRPSPAIRVVDSGPLCDMTVADSRDEASRFTKREADEIDPVGWSIDTVQARSDNVQQAGNLIPEQIDEENLSKPENVPAFRKQRGGYCFYVGVQAMTRMSEQHFPSFDQ